MNASMREGLAELRSLDLSYVYEHRFGRNKKWESGDWGKYSSTIQLSVEMSTTRPPN